MLFKCLIQVLCSYDYEIPNNILIEPFFKASIVGEDYTFIKSCITLFDLVVGQTNLPLPNLLWLSGLKTNEESLNY